MSRVEAGEVPLKDFKADLLQITNVCTVHLKFTPEQWETMEPAGGGGFFGGSGGPGEFGPAMFVAPAFLKAGHQNQDVKLSKEEFLGWIAQRWRFNGESLLGSTGLAKLRIADEACPARTHLG